MSASTAQRLRRRHRSASIRAPRLVALAPSTGVGEAVHRLQSAGQALALVVRGIAVVGVVDLEDLRFARDWRGPAATVAEAMTIHVTERPGAATTRDVRPY